MKENQTAKILLHRLDERQGENLLAYDISTASLGADVLIIATGRNTRHVSALADELVDLGREEGLDLASREGRAAGGWILLDFSSIIVNILDPQNREYYALERLWKEFPALADSSAF